MRRDFNTIVIIGGGGLNTEAMGFENEDFSDEDQCQCMYIWEFFAYIPTRVFQFFFLFFFYCHCYYWYYLKGCFVILCFKNAEVLKFVKICQKEVLSEERQLMKWVRIFQVRIFWVAIFRAAIFLEGVWWVGIFRE